MRFMPDPPSRPSAGPERGRGLVLVTEFAAQPLGGVVEKQADFGGKMPSFRVHDVNRRGRRLVIS
jgi:hypothetical protein